MSIIVKEGVVYDRENPPAGPVQGVCFKVFDVGVQASSFGEAHKILIVWEITTRYTKGDFKDKRMLVNKPYTASLGPKANLRKDLEQWKGKPFNEFELKGFDIERLVGVNCMLNIVLESKGENTYANVGSIMGLPAGMEKITCECLPDFIPGRVKKLLETQIPQADPETDAIADKAWGEAAKKEPAAPATDGDLEIF
jgi:hypothetical protein